MVFSVNAIVEPNIQRQQKINLDSGLANRPILEYKCKAIKPTRSERTALKFAPDFLETTPMA